MNTKHTSVNVIKYVSTVFLFTLWINSQYWIKGKWLSCDCPSNFIYKCAYIVWRKRLYGICNYYEKKKSLTIGICNYKIYLQAFVSIYFEN